jgi:hypothetical protein
MVFFQIRQQKGLRIAWSKRLESFVKLISKNSTITAFVLPCIPPF